MQESRPLSLQPNGTQKRNFDLSSKKKKSLWKIPLIIICTLIPLVVWLGFSDQGFIHLYRTEIEHQAYVDRINQLTKENQELLDEINRLRTDKKYIEQMARKHFNMVKSNEVIYRFDQEEPSSDVKAQHGSKGRGK